MKSTRVTRDDMRNEVEEQFAVDFVSYCYHTGDPICRTYTRQGDVVYITAWFDGFSVEHSVDVLDAEGFAVIIDKPMTLQEIARYIEEN